MNKELKHYGTPQRFAGDPKGSGRYRKGSGDNPYQSGSPFLARVNELKASGMTEAEIAKALGMSTTQLRAKKSIEKQEQIGREVSQAVRLKDHGYSNTEIGRIMGLPESTIRNRLDPTLAARANRTANLADQLKAQVEDKTYLDIGAGVEHQLGVSAQSLKTAVAMLEEQGYKKHYLKVEQATNPGKNTYVMVLTKKGVEWKEVYNNRDKIMSPAGVYSEDGGKTFRGILPPLNIDSKRIQVRYGDEGGSEKDGVIELRRGVEDISLGSSQYAQVRIAVDGTHYLKGMAMYNDNMPKGVDIIFNTNKPSGTPIMSPNKDDEQVFKHMKSDPDNPFGSTVRQLTKGEGDDKKLYSACNIVNDPTDWDKWSRNLSSQFLSKQDSSLAKRQLDIAYKIKKQEYDDICALTNPTIKKSLLLSFADECDSDAVHLKAAALPRQQTQVILPVTSLKDNEVYAPNFRHGEEVALVRYPHGGTFEIPILKVNKNNKEGKSLLGNAPNAIGINSNVAKKLSGADFDGDTVIVIPTKGQKIKTSTLKELENFDPSDRYPAYPGMPKVSKKTGFDKQMEMGKVSNLITDMTLQGASGSEIARAVRHSMVVIDAEKHNLNWRQSFDDNAIAQLKEKYQGGKNKGASTLISKANSPFNVPARKEWMPIEDNGRGGINPKTGEKIFVETGETRIDKKGKTILRTEEITKMENAKDARSLIDKNRGTKMEYIYADHANNLKALANQARKEYISTPNQKYNPSAKKVYSEEVYSLNKKLTQAVLNAPRERQAQLLTDSIYRAKVKANPDMEKEEKKKLRAQILDESRSRVGAVSRAKRNINITDREWEAIQAGAISNNKLTQIIRNSDEKAIKERATPKNKPAMTASKIARAKSLLKMGYTQAEVADYLGVSTSTINKQVNM